MRPIAVTHSEPKLGELLSRLQGLLDVSPDCVLFLDARGHVLSANRAVECAVQLELEKSIIDRIVSAPRAASLLEVVAGALEAAGADLQERRDIHFVRALCTRHEARRDPRARTDQAGLAAVAVTKALHTRGVSEPAASLAAEAGMAVFKVGFERWVNERKPQRFAAHIRAPVKALKALTAAGSAQPRLVRSRR